MIRRAPRVLSLASLLFLAGGEQVAVAQTCSEGIFFASAAVVAGSTIYDIASAPASARHYNQSHLSIAPLVDPRHGSYGLSASWRFGRSSRLASRSITVPVRKRQAAPATKSPSTAFVLSFASTAAPMLGGALMANANIEAGWVFIFGGLVIGPSVGHFYVGNVGRGLGTVALRAAGTAIGLYAIAPCFDD